MPTSLKNTTSSLADPALDVYREVSLTPEVKKELESWSIRFEKSRPAIEQHLEKRVSYLFMQAVLCYKTYYTFREGHTSHQGMSAHCLTYDPGKKIVFNAAHSATIPCLYACSSESQEEEVVYLYRSGAYDESNATIDMIKEINDADRAIDEKYSISELRSKTIELLNKTAKGELTPEAVAKQFSEILLSQIDRSLEKEKNEHVKEVLELYREKAELLWSYIDNPENIDRWLDLNVDDPDLSAISVIVDQLHKEIPTTKEEILTLIKKKVNELPITIYSERYQKSNEYRTSFHFYDLYYYSLLRLFKGKENDLKMVEEAIGVSLSTLRSKALTFQRTSKTGQILCKNEKKIQALSEQIFILISCYNKKYKDSDRLEGLVGEKKIALRPNIYKLRYQMIQNDQKAQSKIKIIVENALKQIKKQKGSKPYLDLLFYHSLFNLIDDINMRRMFTKLLNISSVGLEQEVTEIKINKKAYTILESNTSNIRKLALAMDKAGKATPEEIKKLKDKTNDLCKMIQSQTNVDGTTLNLLIYKRLFNYTEAQTKPLLAKILSTTEEMIDEKIKEVLNERKSSAAETIINSNEKLIRKIIELSGRAIDILKGETMAFRQNLMKELRMSHGMSQKHFKALYINKFPAFPMSDGTMHNLENGLKTISPQIIEQLSEIFEVQKSLFTPSHFIEN